MPLFSSRFASSAEGKWSPFGATHDDVIKWKHFPRYWPFVRGIHRSPVDSPLKGQWRGVLIFSLIFDKCQCFIPPHSRGWLQNSGVTISVRQRLTFHSLIQGGGNKPAHGCFAKSVFINPANTKRNKHIIITSKQRFDVIITCLLRFVFAGKSLRAPEY